MSIPIVKKPVSVKVVGQGTTFQLPKGTLSAAAEHAKAQLRASAQPAVPVQDAWGDAPAPGSNPPQPAEHASRAPDSPTPSSGPAAAASQPVLDSWESADEGEMDAVVAAAAARAAASAPQPQEPERLVAELPPHSCQPVLLLHTSKFLEGVPAETLAEVEEVVSRVQGLILGADGGERADQLLSHGYAMHSHTGRAAADVVALKAALGKGDRWDTLLYGSSAEWAYHSKATLPTLPLLEGGTTWDTAPPVPSAAAAAAADAEAVSDCDSHGDSSDEDTPPSAAVASGVPAWLALVGPHSEPWACVDAARWVFERANLTLAWKGSAVAEVTDLADREAFALQLRASTAAAGLAALWRHVLLSAEAVVAHEAVADRLQGALDQLKRIQEATSSAMTGGTSQSSTHQQALASAPQDRDAMEQEVARSSRALLSSKVQFVKALLAVSTALAGAQLPAWTLGWIVTQQGPGTGKTLEVGADADAELPVMEPEALAGVCLALPTSATLPHESQPGVASSCPGVDVLLLDNIPDLQVPETVQQAVQACRGSLAKRAESAQRRFEGAVALQQHWPLSSILRSALKACWKLHATDSPQQHSLRCAVVLSRVEWLWLSQFGRLPPPSQSWSEESDTSMAAAAACFESPPQATKADALPSQAAHPPPIPASTVVTRGRTAGRAKAVARDSGAAQMLMAQAGLSFDAARPQTAVHTSSVIAETGAGAAAEHSGTTHERSTYEEHGSGLAVIGSLAALSGLQGDGSP